MNKRVKGKWVAALRSGKYKQGRNSLRSPDGFCCLGVLCDVSKGEIGGEWVDLEADELLHEEQEGVRSTAISFKPKGVVYGNEVYLPEAVKQWAGLDSTDPIINPQAVYAKKRTAAECNDKGLTFDEIADLIEANL